MATKAETFEDTYTRKVGGERYDYEVAYVPASRVMACAGVPRRHRQGRNPAPARMACS